MFFNNCCRRPCCKCRSKRDNCIQKDNQNNCDCSKHSHKNNYQCDNWKSESTREQFDGYYDFNNNYCHEHKSNYYADDNAEQYYQNNNFDNYDRNNNYTPNWHNDNQCKCNKNNDKEFRCPVKFICFPCDKFNY